MHRYKRFWSQHPDKRLSPCSPRPFALHTMTLFQAVERSCHQVGVRPSVPTYHLQRLRHRRIRDYWIELAYSEGLTRIKVTAAVGRVRAKSASSYLTHRSLRRCALACNPCPTRFRDRDDRRGRSCRHGLGRRRRATIRHMLGDLATRFVGDDLVLADLPQLNLSPERFALARHIKNRLVPRWHDVSIRLRRASMPAQPPMDLGLHVVDRVDDIQPQIERNGL